MYLLAYYFYLTCCVSCDFGEMCVILNYHVTTLCILSQVMFCIYSFISTTLTTDMKYF